LRNTFSKPEWWIFFGRFCLEIIWISIKWEK
jgi:hypothetical protein